jgi:hypothetical protein
VAAIDSNSVGSSTSNKRIRISPTNCTDPAYPYSSTSGGPNNFINKNKNCFKFC